MQRWCSNLPISCFPILENANVKLCAAADGDEGGRHQFIKGAVSDGNVYLLKVQAGDKRFFKGADKECEGAIDSFTVV